MKKVNWGIIGLGSIANKFADGFSIINNATVKGIASLNTNNLQSFKEELQIQISSKKLLFVIAKILSSILYFSLTSD